VLVRQSSTVTDVSTVNAVDLLTAFSGECAKQHEPYFRFTQQARIVSVEIHALGTESTKARYCGEFDTRKEVNNILRITTADGFEGLSGVDTDYQGAFGEERLLELQGIAADLLALQSLDPVEVGKILERTMPDLSDEARSSIDIAL